VQTALKIDKHGGTNDVLDLYLNFRSSGLLLGVCPACVCFCSKLVDSPRRWQDLIRGSAVSKEELSACRIHHVSDGSMDVQQSHLGNVISLMRRLTSSPSNVCSSTCRRRIVARLQTRA